MTDELSLFGEESQGAAAAVEPDLSDADVAALRAALDALGLVTMAERRRAIEELAYREVPSLRQLRTMEARVILDRLRGMSAARHEPAGASSAWDSREGDTWIDRL